MVSSASSSELLDQVRGSCKSHLSEILPDDLQEKFASKVVDVCEELGIASSEGLCLSLDAFIFSASKLEKPLAPNIRIIRQAMKESEFIKPVIEKAESAHQNSDIIYPDYVDDYTRGWLKDFDKTQIQEALDYGSEILVQRVLAGFVKQAKDIAMDNMMEGLRSK